MVTKNMPIALPLGLLGVAVLLMASIKSQEEAVPAPAVKGELPERTGPTRGEWPYDGLPFRVTFDGRLFQRAAKPPKGVAGYYREVRGPGEVAVTAAGRFVAV
jgi:hypothetical protein